MIGICIRDKRFQPGEFQGFNCAAAFLLAGLVFSLTYLSTVVVKHARGVILGAGSLLAYMVLEGVVPHYWPRTHLPSRILSVGPVFTGAARIVTGETDHYASSITIRAGIVLLFPIVTQFVLQKTDIGE